jgi:archaellum component FlaC
MQKKEMMTQPRTDTATLIEACRVLARDVQSGDGVANSALREIADRLEEQEATIRHLRVEICNASAILMTHLEAIKTIQAEVDLLNKRPKR